MRTNVTNKIKVLFLISFCLISLCTVATLPVKSQGSTTIYILSDGSLFSESGVGAPIQREGDVYTFMDNLEGFSLIVQRSNVVIDGGDFYLSGDAESAIDLSYTNGVTVRNVRIVGVYYYGILLSESSGVSIVDNSISGNVRGIFVYNSTGNTISGNSFVNNEIGIDLRSSTNNIFRNNNLNNNQNLVVFGSLLSHYANDIDASNLVGDDKNVYYLVNERNLLINPNTFADLGILALVNCNNITVRNIELTNNGQGIILAFTSNSKLESCSISDNHNGILFYGASNNEVTDSIITNNYRAIQFSKASDNNRITTSTIINNSEGILLFESSANTFVNNNIENNGIGIGFSSSSNNMIRGNYFTNNTDQVYDAGEEDSSISSSSNYWNFDYPIGGNYWSDYAGVDLKSGVDQDQSGGDNIGDSPYTVYGNNRDEYPLMPYGNPFAISIESPRNRTYSGDSLSLSYVLTDPESAIISYSLDGQANITISSDTTLSNLSEGKHKLTVYAKNSEGNENSDTVYFTITQESEAPTENDETQEEFPIMIVVAIIGIIAIVGFVLFYFLKIKK